MTSTLLAPPPTARRPKPKPRGGTAPAARPLSTRPRRNAWLDLIRPVFMVSLRLSCGCRRLCPANNFRAALWEHRMARHYSCGSCRTAAERAQTVAERWRWDTGSSRLTYDNPARDDTVIGGAR